MTKLADKKNCTGCTACANACPHGCITMQEEEFGFLYPRIGENCIHCGMCKRACPILNPTEKSKDSMAFAAYSKNDATKMNSSSGGLFTELAEAILADGGVVYGSEYDSDYKVRYCAIEDSRELYHLQGAKYSQSILEDTFKEVRKSLESGQKVLFVGMPCAVAGLKLFLYKDYPNLFCIDFVCHGVPSPKAWKEYVRYRAEADNSGVYPKRINQRSKISGWSRYRYSIVYDYSDTKKVIFPNGQDLFMDLFVKDYINRDSCQDCRFKGIERFSDITIGDFWGIWNVAPEIDDSKGISLVICHSVRGQQLLKQIKNRVCMSEVTFEDAIRENPSIVNSAIANTQRKKILTMACKGQYDEIEKEISRIGVRGGLQFRRPIRKLFDFLGIKR